MKNSTKILSAVLLGLSLVACSSANKMAQQASKVTVECEPAVLEIVWQTVAVSLSIVWLELLQTVVVVLAGRDCSRTTRTVICIHGEAVALSELIVTYKLEFVWTVELCREPVSSIYRISSTLVVLAQEGARI